MTPQLEAAAYRIWAYANAREWDCTPTEAARAVGIEPRQAASIIRWKGWTDRCRANPGRAEYIARLKTGPLGGVSGFISTLQPGDMPRPAMHD